MGIGNYLFMAAGALVLGMNVMVYQHGNNIMEMFSPSDPLARSPVPIVGHRTDHGFQDGYLQMASHDQMRAGRHVAIETLVPIRSLLEQGEAPPRGDDVKLFASSRAVLYAQEECARLVRTLAALCEVRRADARVNGDHVEMKLVLAFVENAPFGSIEGAPQRVYAKTTRTFESAANNMPLSRAAAERERIYALAARGCREIRAREDNCSITEIRVAGKRPSPSGIGISADVHYAFLAAKN